MFFTSLAVITREQGDLADFKKDPQRSDTTEPQSSDPPTYEQMQGEYVDIDLKTSDDDLDFIRKREKDYDTNY